MENEKRRKSNTSGWLIVGVLVLIVLLIIWLTIADFSVTPMLRPKPSVRPLTPSST